MKRTINQQVASRMASLEQKYHASLERCLQKGEDALICRDVELCEHVEVVLRTGNTQVLLGPMTLDSQTLDMLSVMETSLQNPGASLEGVERTFEVLELAALNLYLCPWRKEYRVVKMFSGTFTHQVSPVLSKQQTKELFGLLGYQAVAGHSQCEELELKGSPLPAKFLLRFACLFFIARCECRLLYSVAKVLGGRQTLELALVQERQRGCSLERAQQSLQSKMEMSQQGENAEDELDLYTAEASNGESGLGSATKTQASFLRQSLHPSCGGSELSVGSSSLAFGSKALSISTFQHQVTGDGWSGSSKAPYFTHQRGKMKSTAADALHGVAEVLPTPYSTKNIKGVCQKQCLTCNCSGSNLYTFLCEQCHVHHNSGCLNLRRCEEKGHATQLSSLSDTAKLTMTGRKVSTLPKERASGEEELEEKARGGPVEWHTCIVKEALSLFFCHTCNLVHDVLCVEACLQQHHELLELSVLGVNFSSVHVMLHHCLLKTLGLMWICQICKVLHTPACIEMERCQRFYHHTRMIGACSAKNDCSRPAHLLCRFCFLVYCKECWFRNPLVCSCGQSFCNSTAV
ncbi:spermatogenesis associated 2-like isoform X2 [Scleropages formosus]|uniref:spermatogenesis associated 2-like isoform X2 n=1 Tax=Scleropages formosus TaxID=113540 RepID=UPI000878053B|nr:spermatogenesis-associated protein 2-like protein isoform X2 [Scleropages formosus]